MQLPWPRDFWTLVPYRIGRHQKPRQPAPEADIILSTENHPTRVICASGQQAAVPMTGSRSSNAVN